MSMERCQRTLPMQLQEESDDLTDIKARSVLSRIFLQRAGIIRKMLLTGVILLESEDESTVTHSHQDSNQISRTSHKESNPRIRDCVRYRSMLTKVVAPAKSTRINFSLVA